MKRFKTVLVILCPSNHQNLIDDRVLSETPEEARNTTLLNMQRRKCKYCPSLLTNKVNLIGTEEISLHEIYNVLGYRCHCGERVEVSRAAQGLEHEIPTSITVQCSKGHSRTVLNQEFPFLETWTEQTQ
jgi:hypothetical protein